ncbi:hypothetical protein KFK09_003957 [Dendrobium nobile]|uniref:Uncharacterized protein n=1 Tax=Dendrobium nobile TaxID=94219 RepID=A0A8T3C2N7_DENNO|nr:hypothetical protein KFK09_003957 [Dendrobium nobile]
MGRALSSTLLIHIRRQKLYPSTSQDYGQLFRDVNISSQGLMDKDPSVNLSIQHRFKPSRLTWSVIIAELSPSLPYTADY